MKSWCGRGSRKQPQFLLGCLSVFPVVFVLVFGLPFCGGCGFISDSAASGGRGATAAAALPEGWRVYMPDLEFSTVARVGEQLFAGGLNGLYRYVAATDTWESLEAEGVPFRLVKAIAQDKAGNVWIGHDQGLTCLPAEALGETVQMTARQSLQEVNGQRVKSVNTILVASDGTVYAGTYDGAVSLPPDAVSLWLAHGQMDDITLLGTADGLINPMVNVIYEDSRGFLWFGAYIARNGGVACLRDGEVQHFNHANGLADDYVTTITADTAGDVWVGSGVYTSGGAARFVFEDGRYRAAGLRMLSDGLAGDKVRYIHADQAGRLWFCSEYDGVAVFSAAGARLALLTEAEGLPDNEVKRIIVSSDDSLWFACRRGLLRLSDEAVARIFVER